MSRAFVREEDSAPSPPPLERPVSGAPNLVTPRGARLIDDRISRLEGEIAAAGGNAEAEPLRRELRYWTTRRATAQLSGPPENAVAVSFGCRVSIRRQGQVATLEIIGEDEANPAEGRIAWTSPLARALDGAQPGDTVRMEAGGRSVPIEVLALGPGSG